MNENPKRLQQPSKIQSLLAQQFAMEQSRMQAHFGLPVAIATMGY